MRKQPGFATAMIFTAAAGVIANLADDGVLRIPGIGAGSTAATAVLVAVFILLAYLFVVGEDLSLVFRAPVPADAIDALARTVAAQLEQVKSPETGDESAAVAQWRQQKAGMLVILGQPFSGKTALAQRCARDLLADRAGGGPVPVLLSVAGWSPVNGNLAARLAEELAATYPMLGAFSTVGRRGRRQRRSAAASLVDAGAIVPMLDDFDRLPLGRRQDLFAELSALKTPVVLISREAQFVESKTGATPSMTVVRAEHELEMLPYAALRTTSASSSRFAPWHITTATAASEWLSASLGERQSTLRLRLPHHAADFKPGESWTSQLRMLALETSLRVAGKLPPQLRTLEFLAHELRRLGERDIAWWRLRRMVPKMVYRVVAVVFAALAGVSASMAVALPIPTTAEGIFGLVIALSVLALLSEPAARSTAPAPVRVRLSRGLWLRWAIGACATGTLGASVLVMQGAPVADVLWFVAACAGAGLVGGVRSGMHIGFGDEVESPQRSLRDDRVLAVLMGGLGGLITFVVLAVTGGLAHNALAAVVLCVVVAVAVSSTTAYYRYLVATVWLWLLRRAPLRLFGKLEHAAALGLLFRRGGVYLFRHNLVQDVLAVHRGEQSDALLQVDLAAADAVSDQREDLVDRAFKRADVHGAVEAERIDDFKATVADLVQSSRDTIVATTALARERFVAAKSRYVKAAVDMWPFRAATTYGMLSLAIAAASATTWLISEFGLPQSISAAQVARVIGAGLVLFAAGAMSCAYALVERSPESQRSMRIALKRIRLPLSLDFWRTMAAVWRVSRSLRVDLPGVVLGATACALGVLAVLFVVARAPALLKSITPSMFLVALGVALLLAVAWAGTRRARRHAQAVQSDFPDDWPSEDDSPRYLRLERQAAITAYEDWIRALVEDGVLPLIADELPTVAAPSYDTTLPDASVRKLSDITKEPQFVPTDTSARLTRMLHTMSSGAIGLSGPRGSGKSTVLRAFGEHRFSAGPTDLTLLVSAPTNYNSRDFLVHLFASVCELIVPPSSEPAGVRRRRGRLFSVLTFGLGTALAAGGLLWPQVQSGARWVSGNIAGAVAWAGAALMAVTIAYWITALVVRWFVRTEVPVGSLEASAQRHLARLRYLETTVSTSSAALKPPGGVELGYSRGAQQAAVARTFPELVADFKGFLQEAALRQDGRVVVCVDELDKIGTAADAERFINDLKSVFGVEGCFYLVAVSEDALAAFDQRTLAVRTTFDSAFDAVIKVPRFGLADTRRFLVQRVLRLPEPYVWLCHALSGGLPRDLNRIVHHMYDLRASQQISDLASLTRELVGQDLATQADAQLARVRGGVDGGSNALVRWLAQTHRVGRTPGALLDHRGLAPELGGVEPPELSDRLQLLRDQSSSYLHYAATLMDALVCKTDSTIAAVRDCAEQDNPFAMLAEARTLLSVDPLLANGLVDAAGKALDRLVSRAQV
ncbi:hypothetical protein LFM09_46455 [Lentzea alba]|uniref:hypothetical protein n=1 Tax=Lentzea alba TaxID=2714351 RepID=UPI0039BFABEE